MARTYTDEQRAEGVALCLEVGMAEAHNRTGIPKPTLSRWLTPEQQTEMAERFQQKTAAATEASRQHWAELRAVMVDEAGDVAQRLLRLIADHTGDLAPSSPRDAKDLATAMAILVDKAQLLSGDATSRPSMPWSKAEVVAEAAERAEGLRVIEGGG